MVQVLKEQVIKLVELELLVLKSLELLLVVDSIPFYQLMQHTVVEFFSTQLVLFYQIRHFASSHHCYKFLLAVHELLVLEH